MKNNTLMIIIGVVILAAVGIFALQGMQSKPADTEVMTEETITEEPMMAEKTIVDVAVENGSFKTLVAAVEAAGLVETLTGAGPFTVFAPTDEAFAKLPEGTVEGLLKDKEALTKILTYHVVSGKVMASDVIKLESAKTVQGQEVMVAVEGEKVMINDATVAIPDVEASNGVIHVIDTVLMPK